MWAKRAFLLAAFTQNLVAKSFFSAGTLLQAHGPLVLAGTELAYAFRPAEEGLSFALRLPLLFHENGQIVYPKILNPPGPKFYEKSSSSFYVLEEFLYRKKNHFFGIGNLAISENHDFLLWGNPFFEPLAPYVVNGFAIQYNQTYIRSAPLSHFHLWYLRQDIKPFTKENALILDTLKIKTQVFGQKKENPTVGGGISIENLFYFQNEIELGQKQTFMYIWENENLWQYTAGLYLGYSLFSFGTGFLAKSKNHPYGPYLSYLTLGRVKFQDIPQSSAGYISFSYKPKNHAIHLLAESYSSKIFSFRSEWEFRQKSFQILLGFLKEGLNSKIPQEAQTFYVLKISYFAVGDFLVFKSENFYNFYETLSYRAMLSLTWTF